MEYKSIKIDHNGDAATMLEELPELLKRSRHYQTRDFSTREAVEIAIIELYEKLKADQ